MFNGNIINMRAAINFSFQSQGQIRPILFSLYN